MSIGPVMLDLEGLSLDPGERDMLCHPQIGGVILFARNYEDPDQVAELVRQIRVAAGRHILVAVDQEGGRVQRFLKGFTPIPAAGTLGLLYDRDKAAGEAAAEDFGWLIAAELRAVDVDISFTPILDLGRGVSGVIGDRAFHHEPEVVALLARAVMRGMQQAGMAATGKHFPGHGSVAMDSHYELPVDDRPYADIVAEDMVAFERMIHFGLPAIMAAHVLYPRVDSLIADFSSRWMQDILRGELGFQGVIFSDDLSMAAAGTNGDVSDRARQALDAGCDMILVCNDPAGAISTLESLAGYSAPASQVRLIRMLAKPQHNDVRLQDNPRWQSAVTRVCRLEVAQPLDLDL